jgi:hypothetical protein
MATRLISQNWQVEGVFTNVTTAKLSDPTGTYGVKQTVSGDVVVADATAMTNSSTGVYEYSFTDAVGIAYTAYVEIVYDGATYHFEHDIPARSASGAMVASYSSLLSEVGEEMFGLATGLSLDQTDKVERCIKHGLRRVYAAHEWSFFRPLKDLVTTAPYSTGTVEIVAGVVTLTGGTFPSWAADGLLKASSNYYSVASRDSGTQITLDDTSVAVSAASSFDLGRPEIPLDDDFIDLSGDRNLNYYPDQNELYPPVREKHDQAIRAYQQNDPYYDRPVFFSIRQAEFNPTVGSRKRLAFYPTPDAAYVLRCPQIIRPTMIDAINQFPVGAEMLSQVITEACMAASEKLYDDKPGEHDDEFMKLLPLAIAADQERSSPTSLGSDAPRDEYRSGGLADSYYWLRSSRIGGVSIDGTGL